MFLGAVMILLTAIIVMRASSQGSIEVTDARWEQSLHVAEGSMDDFLAELSLEADPDGVNTGHTASQLSDKAAIIAVADEYAAANPDEVYMTPEGEAVVLKPSDDQVMYAVGFTPSRTADGRQARVLELKYEYGTAGGTWSAVIALLVGEDIKISGDVVFKWDAGGLHANGSLDLDGKVWADACVTVSIDLDGETKNVKKVGPGCEKTEAFIEGNDPIALPEMAPRDIWWRAEYQMCPDGKVRAGPSHPTYGNGGVVTASAPFDEPCRTSAQMIFNADGSEYRGWKMTGWDDKQGAKWDYTSNSPNDGAYYFYNGSVFIGANPANWDVWVVTEATRLDSGNPDLIGNKRGGDISISGNIKSFPYYADTDVNMFADRDLDISGNKNAEGMMIAMEQLKMSGNPSIDGNLVVHSQTDTPDSNIHDSEISGNPTIRYSGGGTTEWTGSGSGEAELTILKRTER